ncbi:sporulation-specific diadenylate cyclase CdaS [Paenibacillus sedimenti]|uniref:Diadenylate cyclase n=1 Tax=Paenibacillus sedimenti TaxID=2770274 RepID=A0A926QM75_9BACL|nr:sporulation-specific diadenylate cyclase CdaS [Paenibacillus sedimenti]MBD0384671.1 DNA integrity scanning protein DisA nucleotide-binding domain protein [Paenibacillus sedimenti]
MQQNNCDVSPVKEQLKQYLRHIVAQIQRSLDMIDNENYCLLSEFYETQENFKRVESIAGSFYLQCYLSSFTSNYLDLSISIKHLSERRQGALIVIERNDPLQSNIHSGITVEAALTHSLLESIFIPGSPLHDGAVLVRGDRIISAANVLPVSDTMVIDKKLGTRHRAAIGLTEKTDALVLVVSEETGNISFAYRGKLYPLTVPESIGDQ